MIKKKSDYEIKLDIEKKIKSTKYPKIFSIIFFILVVISFKTGFNPKGLTISESSSWTELFEALPLIIFLSALVFFGTLLYQRTTKRLPLEKPTYICLNCEETFDTNENKRCECGGEILPIDEVDFL